MFVGPGTVVLTGEPVLIVGAGDPLPVFPLTDECAPADMPCPALKDVPEADGAGLGWAGVLADGMEVAAPWADGADDNVAFVCTAGCPDPAGSEAGRGDCCAGTWAGIALPAGQFSFGAVVEDEQLVPFWLHVGLEPAADACGDAATAGADTGGDTDAEDEGTAITAAL